MSSAATSSNSFLAESPAQTRLLGCRLGRLLKPGDILGLVGELGAGKTCLIQGIAEGMRIKGTYVNSPTFTMVNVYPGNPPLYHVDLYRISSRDDLETIGLNDYLSSEGVCVIEWFDRLPGGLAADHMRITLLMEGEKSRRILLEPCGERYAEISRKLLRKRCRA